MYIVQFLRSILKMHRRYLTFLWKACALSMCSSVQILFFRRTDIWFVHEKYSIIFFSEQTAVTIFIFMTKFQSTFIILLIIITLLIYLKDSPLTCKLFWCVHILSHLMHHHKHHPLDPVIFFLSFYRSKNFLFVDLCLLHMLEN